MQSGVLLPTSERYRTVVTPYHSAAHRINRMVSCHASSPVFHPVSVPARDHQVDLEGSTVSEAQRGTDEGTSHVGDRRTPVGMGG